ncbi:YdcF family protein [Microlunatus antarcticus]|uniref:Uncharacterized SAM-binding protein YcdF (DUF218 family) n=1 Tax=Microlunatus antarcticus TaxID=53388 RepID=A0A7W5JUT5_9ACTN|nr:uncharacterized SAM-binding protein YcdF (DUF218 family) [Microlunatus antarcticus]
MSSLILAAVFAVLYGVFRQRDRRLLRNGVFLVGALFFGLVGVLGLLVETVPVLGVVVVALLALLPAAVLVLAGFLVANGLTMVRKEGRSLANLLSLVAGLAVLAVPVAAVLLAATRLRLGILLAVVLVFAASYLGVVFVAFLVYSLVYGRTRFSSQPAAVVVLGSRIIDGRVPPLLRSRLDRAVQVYRLAAQTGRPPLLIPSGGQGADETRPEGEAMAEYLLAQGVDPADVRPEERATTTRENLVLSAAVQEQAGRPGPVLAVTNSYHTLRAAMIARDLGLDAQVVGSPTARYYVPSAFLREFVAVLVEQRTVHAVVLGIPFLLGSVLLVLDLTGLVT